MMQDSLEFDECRLGELQEVPGCTNGSKFLCRRTGVLSNKERLQLFHGSTGHTDVQVSGKRFVNRCNGGRKMPSSNFHWLISVVSNCRLLRLPKKRAVFQGIEAQERGTKKGLFLKLLRAWPWWESAECMRSLPRRFLPRCRFER